MAGAEDSPAAPFVPGEGERMRPPSGGVPPRTGSVDESGRQGRPPRRSARFRPAPSSVDSSGGRPPPAGVPSQTPAQVPLPEDDDTLFGTGLPALGAGGRGSVPRDGESAPPLVPEGPGGSSSRAPPGSTGSLDASVVTAIAQVVREEVGRALQEKSPAPGQASRHERRGEQVAPRREYRSRSPAHSSEASSGEEAVRHGRQEPRDRPKVREIPKKIVVNNPLYADVFDCETYALVNKSVTYTNRQAHTLGRRKKDVAQSFGVRSEWDGTPPLKVFQFLRKFAKACDDNDVSEAEAFFMLQDFTKEPLRSEVMSVMPSRHGGNPGEVSSYLELINWVLRYHADEASLAAQVEEFNRATQSEGEDERTFAERLRQLNVLCGFIHPQGVIKGRFVEGVHRSARATVRERNTPGMTLAELARVAQTKGEEYRWIVSDQRKEREKETKSAEATRLRRAARAAQYPRVRPAVAATSTQEEADVVAAIPETPQGKATPQTSKSDRPCWQCSKTGHWASQCPALDSRLRAILARSMSLGTRGTPPSSRSNPTRVGAITQQGPEGTDKSLEEGEAPTSSSSESTPSSSDSGEGNA